MWVAVIVIVIWVLVWIFPIWNVISTASKTLEQHLNSNPWVLPATLKVFTQFAHNTKVALTSSVMGNALLPSIVNSFVYGIVGAILAIVCAAFAAYALVWLPIRGRFLFFMIIFSGTLFPLQIYLVPLFKFYRDTNLYDTRLGMICFYIAICIPFCTFVLRNWFLNIPKSIVEAAEIDGCSKFHAFIYIFVPLSKSPFLTLFLFQFTWVWNDLIFGMTLTRSRSARPVMALLAGFQSMYSQIGIPAMLASAIVASLPTLLLVLVFQKYFFRGLAMTAGRE
jgi:multiple sugar transport system permease protein